jgi:DNA-binding SARP family transcriptional activator/tetratricopeptide (TPR) repeat protein
MPDEEMASDVDFRLLGPLEAVGGGRPLPLGGAKQRAFLTLLLLHAGELVPRDRLIEDIWGEDAPATAGHALEVYASGLRKMLGSAGASLVSRSGGYVLEIGEEAIDVTRFERLAAEGRDALAEGDAAAADQRLTSALALWRGPALADAAYESFAQAEIARLEELRLAAVEDGVEARLRLGRHAELVGELRALVSANPLRERLIGQLMLALYRTGRQAEALDVSRAARERLADQLGIDPSTELRALETAILRQADELEAPTTRGRGEAPVAPEAPPGREVRKIVSALSVHLDARTADGAAVDPERRRRVAATVAEIAREAAARAGGEILAGAGALVAVFGVPRVHEDDARRAVVAAFAIRDGVRALGETGGPAVDVGIGVDTGEVVTAERDPDLLAADVVAAATDLSRAAPPNEIAIGERTRRLLGDDAVVDDARIDGGASVVRAIAPVSRRPAPAPRAELVGREDELALVLGALERSRTAATCHLVTVLGAPGVGKSRLLDEVAERARGTATVLIGHCLPFGDGITFWPIAEAVRQAASIGDDDGVDEAVGKLRALVSSQSDGGAIADAIARVTGLSAEPSAAGEAPRAVRRLLETLAADRPLVLVIEDLHWAEPTLLDLVSALVDRSLGASVLVLSSARPEFLDEHPSWGAGKANAASVLLEPLSSGDSSELVGRLGGSELPPELVARVLDTAEGNPLFIEQILSMLGDAGPVSHRGRDASGELPPLPIPPTLQALLASRLGTLAPAELQLAQAAAVIGTEFRPADVEALIASNGEGGNDDGNQAALTSLVEKQWLRRERAGGPEPAYRFRHVLMQTAAYESIPKAVRSELHERLASTLERTSGERIAELEPIVGHHLAQATRYRIEVGIEDEATAALAARAARRLRAAGDRAFLRGDMPAAVALLDAAADLFTPDDPERVTMLPRLGTALVEVARFDDAARVLDEAWDRSSAADDAATQAETLYYRTELRAWLGVLDESAAVVEAREMAARLGDEMHAAIARCHRIVAICGPDLATYAEESELAMRHAQLAGDRLLELEILQNLADVNIAVDRPIQTALARCDDLFAIAGDDTVAVNAVRVIALAPLLAHAGRFHEARAVIRVALETYDELGLELWSADAGAKGAAEVEWLAGDVAASGRIAEIGLRALEAMGATGSTGRHLGRCARVAYAQGRFEDAERLVRVGHRWHSAWTLGVAGMLAARRGDGAEGEALARGRLEQHRRLPEGEVLQGMMELAEVLHLSGREGDARALIAQIVERAERRGDVASAELARRWARTWTVP